MLVGPIRLRLCQLFTLLSKEVLWPLIAVFTVFLFFVRLLSSMAEQGCPTFPQLPFGVLI
jgi:hypothetical protein